MYMYVGTWPISLTCFHCRVTSCLATADRLGWVFIAPSNQKTSANYHDCDTNLHAWPSQLWSSYNVSFSHRNNCATSSLTTTLWAEAAGASSPICWTLARGQGMTKATRRRWFRSSDRGWLHSWLVQNSDSGGHKLHQIHILSHKKTVRHCYYITCRYQATTFHLDTVCPNFANWLLSFIT